MNPILILTLAVSLFTLSSASSATARDLRVLVSGIQSDRGEIRCLLFDKEKGFPEPGRALNTVHYPAVPPMLTCTFTGVEPGRYAVAVVHDENGNEEIEPSFMGSLEEPWGVTNNVRPVRRGPTFVEAVIYVSASGVADYEVVVQP